MNAFGVPIYVSLNESPSEKEGKCLQRRLHRLRQNPLNESPSEKEGKSVRGPQAVFLEFPQ